MSKTQHTLTYADVLRLSAALSAMDGGTWKEIEEGKSVLISYRLNSDALFAIVRNQAILKRYAKDIEDFRKKLVMDKSDGTGEISAEVYDADGNKVRNEAYADFIFEYEKYLDEVVPEDIALFTIDVSDLNITGMKGSSNGRTNDIPPSVIGTLLPLLVNMPDGGE